MTQLRSDSPTGELLSRGSEPMTRPRCYSATSVLLIRGAER
jgi:hypothetical protein